MTDKKSTTREQFRLVLRWVKEHQVLARSDTELSKEEREAKKQLWEKLAVELNEIGPPIKTWMAWKRKLSDYKYNLKNKIKRRKENAGSVLPPLTDIDNEALVALLDVDLSDPENISFPDTPPGDEIPMTQVSPENTSALQEDMSEGEDIDRYTRMFGLTPQNDNVSLEMPSAATNNDASVLTKNAANGSPNFNATVTSGSLEAISQLHENSAQFQLSENTSNCQLAESPEDLSKSSTVTLNSDADMSETCKTNGLSGSIEFAPKIEPGLQPVIPNAVELSGMQHYFNSNSSQINEYPDMSHVVMPPFPEGAAPPTPPTLTKEEMDILFSGMVADSKEDVEAKPRKRRGPPRKRPEKPIKRPQEKPEEKKEQKQERKPKRNAQENRTNRPRKVASKAKPKILKDVKMAKKLMSSRVFRHSLLSLLTEANEMEKRRIAITETKVRNQTEIQSLEITRMNLEIMKLQKEIILLEHGGKIFS